MQSLAKIRKAIVVEVIGLAVVVVCLWVKETDTGKREESIQTASTAMGEDYIKWVDVYPLTRFLTKHTQATHKVEGTKEWIRRTNIVDPAVEEAKKAKWQNCYFFVKFILKVVAKEYAV